MNPKTKEELARQGAQIAQAFKWVGGVLVGDGDKVLDEIAACGDPPEQAESQGRAAPRLKTPEAGRRRSPTGPAPSSAREVIEGVLIDEDDE